MAGSGESYCLRHYDALCMKIDMWLIPNYKLKQKKNKWKNEYQVGNLHITM